MKFKGKNKGNVLLTFEINQLLHDIENKSWMNLHELKLDRPDADLVHSDGFYFFNIHIHRTLILLEFEDQEATIVWSGTHKEYETTFRNNKNTVRKWLRANQWI